MADSSDESELLREALQMSLQGASESTASTFASASASASTSTSASASASVSADAALSDDSDDDAFEHLSPADQLMRNALVCVSMNAGGGASGGGGAGAGAGAGAGTGAKSAITLSANASTFNPSHKKCSTNPSTVRARKKRRNKQDHKEQFRNLLERDAIKKQEEIDKLREILEQNEKDIHSKTMQINRMDRIFAKKNADLQKASAHSKDCYEEIKQLTAAIEIVSQEKMRIEKEKSELEKSAVQTTGYIETLILKIQQLESKESTRLIDRFTEKRKFEILNQLSLTKNQKKYIQRFLCQLNIGFVKINPTYLPKFELEIDDDEFDYTIFTIFELKLNKMSKLVFVIGNEQYPGKFELSPISQMIEETTLARTCNFNLDVIKKFSHFNILYSTDKCIVDQELHRIGCMSYCLHCNISIHVANLAQHALKGNIDIRYKTVNCPNCRNEIISINELYQNIQSIWSQTNNDIDQAYTLYNDMDRVAKDLDGDLSIEQIISELIQLDIKSELDIRIEEARQQGIVRGQQLAADPLLLHKEVFVKSLNNQCPEGHLFEAVDGCASVTCVECRKLGNTKIYFCNFCQKESFETDTMTNGGCHHHTFHCKYNPSMKSRISQDGKTALVTSDYFFPHTDNEPKKKCTQTASLHRIVKYIIDEELSIESINKMFEDESFAHQMTDDNEGKRLPITKELILKYFIKRIQKCMKKFYCSTRIDQYAINLKKQFTLARTSQRIVRGYLARIHIRLMIDASRGGGTGDSASELKMGKKNSGGGFFKRMFG